MAHEAATRSSFQDCCAKGRASASVHVCVGLREGPRPLPGRKEEEPSAGPPPHCYLGQLPWMALAFVERSCLRVVSVFELELGACGQPRGGPLCGSVGQGSTRGQFPACGLRAQGRERPALVWVAPWPVSSRPGLGVPSPLHSLSPLAPHLTSRAVPGEDPVGLTWGNSRGPALPSLGSVSTQQKGCRHRGKCLPLGSSGHPLVPVTFGLAHPSPTPHNLLRLPSYFPVVIVIKIGTCGLAMDLSPPYFFLVFTCIFKILHFMTSRNCM